MASDPFDFASAFARLKTGDQREATTPLGGINVRLVRLPAGAEGKWDSHATTAETVIVWSGAFTVEMRDQTLELGPGQCCVVPLGAEHRGSTRTGAEVVLMTTAG